MSLVKMFLLSIVGGIFLTSQANAAEALACQGALPTSDANFCATMKQSAQCHCVSTGLPQSVCQDIGQLYARLISVFGTLERVCAYQHETSKQECIDDWNCYRLGGVDSHGALCSSTGAACM